MKKYHSIMNRELQQRDLTWKKDIAIKQIKAAARHYIKGDYICSITLSGAAEEILGRIAKKRTKTNQLEGEVIYLRDIYDYLSAQ
ncbi:MAG: hypothetical protein IPL53_13925, partial [Ignavibacteria bacterium]|nr:hypothetical protein [Ignavibacteria bacterium]